ncbi:MAG: hypothetical protein ABIQ27_01030 [Flavobacterium sp.]|uniref:hypothetical protein n=1 Tax=Flavobacterium sp. TaxID=239 RepID=UPI003267E2BB
MEKETEQLLPLEFKEINVVKIDTETIPKKKFVEIEFYQSNKVSVENFYKPISKIINLDF